MVKRILIACSLILAAMTVTVFAEEEGYIFKLKDDAIIPFSVVDGVERLTNDTPVYSAESIEDVYDFVDESAIEYIGRDARVYLYDNDFEDEPNDPFYKEYQWNLPMINIPSVWAKGYRGEGSTVCVIDSGINVSHEDIDADNIVVRYNVFDENSDVTDSFADDSGNKKGHGTFVTGIISAVINNKKGIAGIADKAKIVAIKAFDDAHVTDISTLISALDKAAQYDDIDVINMSLGTRGDLSSDTKEIFSAAIDPLVEKGIIVIAAVGNDGNTNVSYPAGFDNVIGVGSVAENKKKCYFSQMNESVFVVAPGGVEKKGGSGGIAGLLNKESNVGLSNGTSYSAPQVAAVAAIAKTIYPQLTTEEFKEILIKTSEDLGDLGYDTYYGWGLIDAKKVIDEVEKLAANPPVIPEETFNPDIYRELKYDSDTNSITVDTDDTEAVVYAARYDGGTLIGVKSYKISELTGNNGVYTITLGTGEQEPSKLFLWHGMRSCIDSWVNENIPESTVEPSSKPVTEPTAKPTAEPTAEPTDAPITNVNLSNSLLSCINEARVKAGVKKFVINEKAMDIMDSYTKDIFENGYDNTMKDSSGKTPMDYISESEGKTITAALYSIKEPSGKAGPEDIAEYIVNNPPDDKFLTDEYTHIAAGTMGDGSSRIWVIMTFRYGN